MTGAATTPPPRKITLLILSKQTNLLRFRINIITSIQATATLLQEKLRRFVSRKHCALQVAEILLSALNLGESVHLVVRERLEG